MNGLPYYKAYPRDFIEGTVGMPFEVKCAYRVVLDLIYMQGGNLPDDARYISGLLGCSIRKWKAIREALVSSGKLVISGEFLTNYRAVSQLETSRKLQEKNAENGSKSRENKALIETTVQLTRGIDTEPDTDTEKKETPTGVSKKRGCRLPDDWMPDEVFGKSEGLSAEQIAREADRFRDYWRGQPGQRGVKLDWHATWKNWVRKAADDKRGKPETPKVANWRDEPEYRGVL